jgi:hypothetical protein
MLYVWFQPMILTSARPSDGATVSVLIRRVGVLAFGDHQHMHVFNILMRHCLQNLELQQVSDNVNKNFNLTLNTLKTKDRLVSSHHYCSFTWVMCVHVCVCVCVWVHACTLMSVTVYYNIIWNLQLIMMTVNFCTVTGMAVRWNDEIIRVCIKFNGMWTCTTGYNQ